MKQRSTDILTFGTRNLLRKKVEYKIRRFCTGYQDFCCEETCDGCLFSQLKSTPIDENQTILFDPEIDDAIKTVTAKTFGFVTTSTTGRIG